LPAPSITLGRIAVSKDGDGEPPESVAQRSPRDPSSSRYDRTVIVHRHPDARPPDASSPWRASPVDRIAFCALWTTGPDTTLDGVVRIRALRPGQAPGATDVFDRLCNPFADETSSVIASERLAREFGVARGDLENADRCSVVWEELEQFLGDRAVFVLECESFAAWRAHFTARSREHSTQHADDSRSSGELQALIGLTDLASLLFPGRIGQKRESILSALTDRKDLLSTHHFDPLDLEAALRELVRRFLDLPEDVLRVFVSGYVRAWRGLSASSPVAANRLLTAMAIIDRPSAWARSGAKSSAELADGRLSACLEHELPLEDLLEALPPRCARESERWDRVENVPPDREEPLLFDAADRSLLDAVFRVSLPASFAPQPGAPTYREGQHSVAGAVADVLGSRELLLVHAPTGTGKTLAYLVPTMLWAKRHQVRIGIATYTRTLQEQAMEREVPRALAALVRSGFAGEVRVSVLKGRENYLCWRALKLSPPDEDDGGESWLAWTALALFGLTDADGDLDHLPLSSPLPLDDSAAFTKRMSALLRQVRAQTACCTNRGDRETCAAELARRRAEKSHVVISNHAFVLARQDFLKHIVFDECEHLHEQAHNAWSHSLGLRSIRSALSRLHRGERGGRNRALLDRLQSLVLEGTPSHASITSAIDASREVGVDVDRLEREIEAFVAWRADRARERSERDDHSLLREYVEAAGSNSESSPRAADLVETRRSLAQRGNELDSKLAELAERLDTLPVRGVPRLRRTLEIVRQDLLEILAAIEAWIPLDEGRPAFRPRTFYDVERDARGNTVLASRVLLPNEFLGRNYHPSLSTGVFLSATTWLQESFEPARAYLGLDRAAEPSEDEERPACVVRTFRAPDVFDYSRVLVAVPRDAPSILTGKDAFLEYVRRFIAHLGERTRGRMLVLFTNAQDTLRIGEELAGFFRARRIPLWFQNMDGAGKEEISELFRSRVDSVLLGVDTFWYGADFPGETLEYLVIVKLPYGVPDRYHYAQCAALGTGEQRRRIYLPRALAKFRQGFGRLMRRESDRGCVFLLDGRVLEPRHRFFLKELPIQRSLERAISSDNAAALGARAASDGVPSLARLVRGDTELCIREALSHMGLSEDVKRRGLDWAFESGSASRTRGIRSGVDISSEDSSRIPSRSPIEDEARAELDSAAECSDRAGSDSSSLRAPSSSRRRGVHGEKLDIPIEDLPY
jgi:Rad3-related DNA helicase